MLNCKQYLVAKIKLCSVTSTCKNQGGPPCNEARNRLSIYDCRGNGKTFFQLFRWIKFPEEYFYHLFLFIKQIKISLPITSILSQTNKKKSHTKYFINNNKRTKFSNICKLTKFLITEQRRVSECRLCVLHDEYLRLPFINISICNTMHYSISYFSIITVFCLGNFRILSNLLMFVFAFGFKNSCSQGILRGRDTIIGVFVNLAVIIAMASYTRIDTNLVLRN